MSKINEKEALDILLEEEFKFCIEGRSALRYLYKNRHFSIKPFTLETLYRIAREVNTLKLESKIDEGALNLISSNTQILIRVLALAVLGDAVVFRKLRLNFLCFYFKRHLTAARLQELFVMVQKMCDVEGFMNSIRLAIGLRISNQKSGILVE